MQSSLYVALSGQLALHRRLETIASNVANASSAGFRAQQV
ncbi:MAG TPA: flagellar basal body protein, partial [Hyphomicrobiaceae bacterium]|nr:flagellar basal body protein [Hyphomicrobiaceae bacterium]